jgi:UDP-N-acetylglucosamine 4,6-dehydratase
MFDLHQNSVLITGGTWSFGEECARILPGESDPKWLIVFSRHELKQHEMQACGFDETNIRYFIGDLRSVDRNVYGAVQPALTD